MNRAPSIPAESDFSAPIVDTDVPKPQLGRLFDLRDEKGLLDVLRDRQLDVETVIRPIDVPSFSLLPAGKSSADAPELPASKRTEEAAQCLGETGGRRIALFDTPPLIQTTESLSMMHVTGQVPVVVRAESTPQPVQLDAFESVPDPMGVWIMLNQSMRSATLGHHYYSYGQRRSARSTGSRSESSPRLTNDCLPGAHSPSLGPGPRPLARGGCDLPAERRRAGCILAGRLRGYLHLRLHCRARFAFAHRARARMSQGNAALLCRLGLNPGGHAERSVPVGAAGRHAGPPRLAVAGNSADCAGDCFAFAYCAQMRVFARHVALSMPIWDQINESPQTASAKMTGVLVLISGMLVSLHSDLIELSGGTVEIAQAFAGLNGAVIGLTVAALCGKIVRDPLWRRLAWLALMGMLEMVANALRIFIVTATVYNTDMRNASVTHDIWFGRVLFAVAVTVFLDIAGRLANIRNLGRPPRAAAALSANAHGRKEPRLPLRARITGIAVALGSLGFLPALSYAMGLVRPGTPSSCRVIQWPQAPRRFQGPMPGAARESSPCFVDPSADFADPMGFGPRRFLPFPGHSTCTGSMLARHSSRQQRSGRRRTS